jgi:HEAT repeats
VSCRQIAMAFWLSAAAACTPFLPSDKAGLMQAMGSNDMAVNFAAAEKFGRLFGALGMLEALQHPNANTRAVAAHFLMDHPSPEVEAALVERTADPDEYVRMWCAFSLGKIGSERSRQVLQHLTHDKSEVVARRAAEALEELQTRLGSGAGGAG